MNSFAFFGILHFDYSLFNLIFCVCSFQTILLAGDAMRVALPFWVAGAGIVASVIGFFFVGTRDGASQRQLMFALHKGVLSSSILVLGFSALIIGFVDNSTEGWKLYVCVAIGLVVGILIGQSTEYFTSYSFWPTQSITNAGVTGPATVIIQGLGVGMISCVPPVSVLVATILGCNALSGSYGIGKFSSRMKISGRNYAVNRQLLTLFL